MFAGDSEMLRNKRHFVISVIAINVFYCMLEIKIHAYQVKNLWHFRDLRLLIIDLLC